MRDENIAVVEQYLNALKQKDLSLAPFDEKIMFEDPVAGKGRGAEDFRAFLSGFLPAINDCRVHRHFCEDEYVVTHWEVDAVFGIIPILEIFRIEDGKITESIAYFDPRLILG